MAFSQRDNSGALWKNEEKRDGKKDPDYTGSATIEGRQWWVDCWIQNNPRSENYDPDKKTFLSLSFRIKTPRKTGEQPKQQSEERPKRQYTLGKKTPPPPSAQQEPEPELPDPETGEYPF